MGFKPKAAEERVSWLEEKARERALKNDTKEETEIKKIVNREEIRRVHRRIRRMNGKERNVGTSMVIAKDMNGQKTEISEQSKLEDAIMQTNKEKFLQCKDTPFYKEPLWSEFDEGCEGSNYDRVLKGEWNPRPGKNSYSMELIKHMERHPQIENTPDVVPTREIQEEWKHSKESTSSGISGLHFGHMKTICKESKEASTILAVISGVAMKTGYSLCRWKSR